nr:alpha/beta hydrolase [Symbiobacterium terraclitae]
MTPAAPRLQERTVPVRGGTLHYFTNGRPGRPLFFLHGAGLDHRMFAPQYPAFDPEYALFAWDARGHGRSAGVQGFSVDLLVADLLAVMDREGIARATLIGQSMGGNLAQEVAMRHPDRVEALVVIDATRNSQRLRAWEAASLRLAAPLLRLTPFDWLVEGSAWACSRRPEVQQYVRECMRHVGKARFCEVMVRVFDFVAYRPELRCPERTLLICGAEDRTGNIRKSMTAWAREEGLEFHMLPGARHNANQDAPEETNRIIREFLRGRS